MKFIQLALIGLLLTCSITYAQEAQDQSAPKKVVESKKEIKQPTQERFFNFRTSPLLPIIGDYSFTGEFSLGESWSIGPSWTHFSLDLKSDAKSRKESPILSDVLDEIFTFEINIYGVNFKKYFSGKALTSSFYVDGLVGLLHIDHGKNKQHKSDSLYTALSSGYHWYFGSGFNLNLGLGVMAVWDKTDAGVLPILDFNLGWAF